MKCEHEPSERDKYYGKIKHVEIYCTKCDKHISFKRQPLPDFVMPIGKHKGMTLSDLKDKEYSYLLWCYENMTNKIGDKIREYLDQGV